MNCKINLKCENGGFFNSSIKYKRLWSIFGRGTQKLDWNCLISKVGNSLVLVE